MHPIFDGSVLTIENRQYEEKKKMGKKKSMLFALFHVAVVS